MSTTPVVLKFGGTSVGSPERFNRVIDIVHQKAARHRVVVVASALSGVTDQLVEAADAAPTSSAEREELVRTLRRRHVHHALDTIGDAEALRVSDGIHPHLERLEKHLIGRYLDPESRLHRDG